MERKISLFCPPFLICLEKMETIFRELEPGMGLAVGGMVRETMEILESVIREQADQKMYENKKSSR